MVLAVVWSRLQLLEDENMLVDQYLVPLQDVGLLLMKAAPVAEEPFPAAQVRALELKQLPLAVKVELPRCQFLGFAENCTDGDSVVVDRSEGRCCRPLLVDFFHVSIVGLLADEHGVAEAAFVFVGLSVVA